MTQAYYFSDANGNPWPRGAVLRVPTLFDHEGVVGYHPWTGEQVMLQNSKRFRRKVATTPQQFNEGRPYVVVSVPSTPEEGVLIEQRAWADVQTGTAWGWFDNCQDFASRAVAGKNGSSTRNLFLGLTFLGGLLFLASAGQRIE